MEVNNAGLRQIGNTSCATCMRRVSHAGTPGALWRQDAQARAHLKHNALDGEVFVGLDRLPQHFFKPMWKSKDFYRCVCRLGGDSCRCGRGGFV